MQGGDDIRILRRVHNLRLALLLLLVMLFFIAAWGGWRLYGAYLVNLLQQELVIIGQITATQISNDGEARFSHETLKATAKTARLENLFIVDAVGRSLGDARPNVKPGSRYSPVLMDQEALSIALTGVVAYGPRQPIAGFAFRSAYVPVIRPDGVINGVVVASAGEEFASTILRLNRAVNWTMAFAGLGLILYLVLFWMGERRAGRITREIDRTRGLALIGMLAAEVAHRIRNPLAIIMTTSETLRKRYREKSGGDVIFDYIPDEVRRVDAAVEQLLSLGRPEPHKLEVFSIVGAIQAAIDLAGMKKRFPEIELSAETTDSGALRIRGDERAITEAASNLIINAGEALKGKGKITVRSRGNADGSIVLIVEDNGPGIPKETLPRLFDPFFTMKANGTGLGLAIAGRIFEQHGAKIRVTTGKRGTSFKVVFPPPEKHPNKNVTGGDKNG